MAIAPQTLARPKPGGGARVLRALLALAAASQLVCFAANVVPKLARAGVDRERFSAVATAPFTYPAIHAHRSLPRLARHIPERARTLLVSTVIDPVAYEFYFVPRPFRLLQQFPPNTIELARQRAPHHAHLFELRLEQMLDRRILYTPQRLQEELRWCEYLVVFAPGGGDVPDLPSRVELVARHGPASLYRVAAK